MSHLFIYRFHHETWPRSPQSWEGANQQNTGTQLFTWNPSQRIYHTSYHWCCRLNFFGLNELKHQLFLLCSQRLFFLLYQTKQPNHFIVYLTSSPDNKEWFMKDNEVWLPLQMIIKEMLDKLQNAAMNDNKLYK